MTAHVAHPGPHASRRLPRAGLRLLTATATALAATAFATPALAADGAPTSLLEITDGTLDWGVKESFRSYVTGPIAHGEITLADGAEEHPDAGFRFTGGTGDYDLATHSVDASFAGGVHFTGHGGTLDLELAGLRVVTEGTERGAIVADVTVAGETTEDVEFAALDLSGVTPGGGEGGAVVLADIPATLTAEGATAFEYNGQPMYPEGTELDPATLTVTAAAGEDPGTEGPGGEDPGAEDPNGEDPAAVTGTVHDGTLDWGVKESFRSYVTGPIANGDVALAGGASEVAAGYRFPDAEGEFDGDAAALDAAFAGGVRFTGHEGALDLSFDGLSVRVTADGAALTADVSSKDMDTGEVNEYDDIAVADLDVPASALVPDGEVLALDAVPATLTAEGAEAFAGFYPAGEELDPVTVTLALDEDAELPGGSDQGGTGGDGTTPTGAFGGASGGALAATGDETPVAGLLTGAVLMTAAGAAATGATRRHRQRAEG
ncbi:HtaA domain-containing protein [Streptomyces sp. B6B3]|uniref:HtaA domain-containing protein n=1 Tax=Streptomyces sp. B6B3 TaxID=3153570 RepID=UPI00325F5A75